MRRATRDETDWSEGLRGQLSTARACRTVVNALAAVAVLLLGSLLTTWALRPIAPRAEAAPLISPSDDDFNPDLAGAEPPEEQSHEHDQ